MSLLAFALEVFVSLGLFMLLQKHGRLLASWSLLIAVGASDVVFLGAVFGMNAAELAGNTAYQSLTDESQRLMLAGLQANSDYTSFHLGLVMGSMAKAGFFYLFLRPALIPRLIAGWGLFASVFVVFMMVARDFILALANNTLSMAFILVNLIAIVSTGLYLAIRGVSEVDGI